jgi:hypothetical protein
MRGKTDRTKGEGSRRIKKVKVGSLLLFQGSRCESTEIPKETFFLGDYDLDINKVFLLGDII